MVRVWESKSVHHAISHISKEHGDLGWHAMDSDCSFKFILFYKCMGGCDCILFEVFSHYYDVARWYMYSTKLLW